MVRHLLQYLWYTAIALACILGARERDCQYPISPTIVVHRTQTAEEKIQSGTGRQKISENIPWRLHRSALYRWLQGLFIYISLFILHTPTTCVLNYKYGIFSACLYRGQRKFKVPPASKVRGPIARELVDSPDRITSTKHHAQQPAPTCSREGK